MNTYKFASEMDGDKFEANGNSLQEAFQTLTFLASDYTDDDDAEEDLRGTRMDVWGWDDDGERHDWTVTFV